MKFPENIQEVADLLPDYMGFIFYPASKRYVLGDHQELFENFILKDTLRVQKIGVFVNEDIKQLIQHATRYGMDILQLHGEETPEYCEQLRYLGFPLIKAFGIDETFDFSVLGEYEDVCDYYLFDTKTASYGGTGTQFNWNLLKKYTGSKPVFLSGGLDIMDIPTVYDLIKDTPVYALDFNSKLEIDYGWKEPEKCKAVIHALS